MTTGGRESTEMPTYRRICARGFWLTAVSLIVLYTFVTTEADLFHNHNDLVERDDCPACLWHQLSQDTDQGPSPAEQIVAAFSVTTLLPPSTDARMPAAGEAAQHQPIRAPPYC